MTDRAPELVAYEAGWRASQSPTNDLDRAEARFDRTHGRDFDRACFFSAGWVDYAAGNPKWTAIDRERPGLRKGAAKG